MRRFTIITASIILGLGLLVLDPGWLDTGAIQDAYAQGKKRGKRAGKAKADAKDGGENAGDKGQKKLKVFDFTGLDVSGQLRAPQLLYFLDRANEELQRASLERRSFIPEMVRSIDEESL